MAMGQNPVPLVNIKIAGKWVFTPLTLRIIGFDTHPYELINTSYSHMIHYLKTLYNIITVNAYCGWLRNCINHGINHIRVSAGAGLPLSTVDSE